jgi:hypothetical protein
MASSCTVHAALAELERVHEESERLERRYAMLQRDVRPGTAGAPARRAQRSELLAAVEVLQDQLEKEEWLAGECLRRVEGRLHVPPPPSLGDVQDGLYLYPDERNATGMPVGCQVAAKVSTGFWIVCRVLRHVPSCDKYVVEDADDQDHPHPLLSDGGGSRKRYTLASRNIVRLPSSTALPPDPVHPSGTPVHAVYPSTTTLYPAVVVAGGGPSPRGWEYLVVFDGDDPPAPKPVPHWSVVQVPPDDGTPPPSF